MREGDERWRRGREKRERGEGERIEWEGREGGRMGGMDSRRKVLICPLSHVAAHLDYMCVCVCACTCIITCMSIVTAPLYVTFTPPVNLKSPIDTIHRCVRRIDPHYRSTRPFRCYYAVYYGSPAFAASYILRPFLSLFDSPDATHARAIFSAQSASELGDKSFSFFFFQNSSL